MLAQQDPSGPITAVTASAMSAISVSLEMTLFESISRLSPISLEMLESSSGFLAIFDGTGYLSVISSLRIFFGT